MVGYKHRLINLLTKLCDEDFVFTLKMIPFDFNAKGRDRPLHVLVWRCL